ncbi:MAG: hypothetical protein ACOYVD_17120 [Bacillota bacterium]
MKVLNLKNLLLSLLIINILSSCSYVKSNPKATPKQQNIMSQSSVTGSETLDKQDNMMVQSSNDGQNECSDKPPSDSQIYNINQETTKASNASEYEGKWISSNYQFVQMEGYTAKFGSELYIKNKNDGMMDIEIYDIAPPPSSRIASIAADVKISKEGVGSFTFNDDGWGSHGNGTIELLNNQIIVNVYSQIEEGTNPDWRFYGGKRVFIREGSQELKPLDISDLNITFKGVK